MKELVKSRIYAKLPSVDSLLSSAICEAFLEVYSHKLIKLILQEEIASTRAQLEAGLVDENITRQQLTDWILAGIQANLNRRTGLNLRYVINATGIILHTNLGRSRLAEEARQNLLNATAGYCNLELDLDTGRRGHRNSLVEKLICDLTGAEAACIVNNNAAAVLLSLNTLSAGKEAIISRGQLIEIGGAFRMPEVMEKSGVHMVEVGTTNKTRIDDYETAISEQTGVLVLAHTSNYRILGFTEEAAVGDVADLGKKYNIPVLHDLGGGVLIDLRKYGLPYEPLVQDSLAAGVDVITFSGDKVLGGPQSGLIVGSKQWLDKIKKNPLMRALRCGKLTYAALEATLGLFFREKELLKKNPTLRMLTEPEEVVHKRAIQLTRLLADIKPIEIGIEESIGQTGSGALPLEQISSWAVTLQSATLPTETIASQLRHYDPPIIPYIKNDKVFLDLRTIANSELELVARAVRQLSRVEW